MDEYPVDTKDFTPEQKALAQSVYVELLHKAGITYDELKFRPDDSTFEVKNPSAEIKIPPQLILDQLRIDDELRRLYTENNPD